MHRRFRRVRHHCHVLLPQNRIGGRRCPPLRDFPTYFCLPPAAGFNLVAWVMPFAVFFSAMGFAVLVVLRWKQRASAAAPATDSPELDAMRLRARRETEL